MHHPDPTERRSLRQIEAALERDRAALAASLETLQDRISVDSFGREAVALMRGNSAPYTKLIDTAVRANPMAAALTVVGLAWLIFGSSKPQPVSDRPATNPPKALSRRADNGSHMAGPIEQQDDWLKKIDRLAVDANFELRRIDAAAQSTLASTRDLVAERAAVHASLDRRVAQALRQGLGGLSINAQDRIVAERKAALTAARPAQRATSRAATVIGDHPFVTGAIAATCGLALAAALPRTQGEDCTFGPGATP